MFIRLYIHFFLIYTPGDVCVCVYVCMYSKVYMYSCACSLSSNRIDLYTVMACEYWQNAGMTALLCALLCWSFILFFLSPKGFFVSQYNSIKALLRRY